MYIILEDGDDAVVLHPSDKTGKVYVRMVTFHSDAWDDTVSAAMDYIEKRTKFTQEIAELFYKQESKDA